MPRGGCWSMNGGLAMFEFATLDVETYCPTEDGLGALQPWRPGFRLSVLGYMLPGTREPRTIPWPTPEQVEAVLWQLANNGDYVVCWNTVFDVASILATLPPEKRYLVHRVLWLDGRDLVQRVDQGRAALARSRNEKWPYNYGLKATVERLIPEAAGYERLAPAWDAVTPGETDDAMRRMLQYNALDVVLTMAVTRRLLEYATDADVREWLRDGRALSRLAEAWFEGILVDTEALRDLEARTAGALDDFLDVLDRWGLPRDALSRPKAKARWLYETLGLPVERTTPGGDPSADKTALAWAALKDPRARVLLEATKLNTRLSKFVKGLWESIEYNGDGRLHPQPRWPGTYTGRFTYESRQSVKRGNRRVVGPVGVALHQMERNPLVRRVIRAPEGHRLVELDAANQEVRWMAVLSGDPVMLEAFQRGLDLHALMASRISGWEYEELVDAVHAGNPDAKRLRTLGKVANLSLQYRTSAAKLRDVALAQYGVVLSEAEAQRMHSAYRELYQQVPRYWERMIYLAQSRGYAETLGGRRVALWDWDRWQWANESTALNTPIQGTGADQKAVWLVRLIQQVPDIRFAWDLHDGLYWYVPEEYADAIVAHMKREVERVDYAAEWGLGEPVPIPMPADVKVGESWGNLVEWTEKEAKQ